MEKSNHVSELIALEKNYNNNLFASAVSAAYVLYLARKETFSLSDHPDFSRMLKMIPDPALRSVVNKLIGDHWTDVYAERIASYSEAELRDFILNTNPDEYAVVPHSDESPAAVNSLLLKILDLKEKDEVGDFCCGTGNFITLATAEQPAASYTGIELDETKSIVARIRSAVLQNLISIKTGDLLQENTKGRFDKIVCVPPWGMKTVDKRGLTKLAKDLPESFPAFSGKTSSDWIFALKSLVSLKRNGTAAVVMTLGAMENRNDMLIRKFLLEKSYIKAVIALPRRLFLHANSASCVLVLQKGDNDNLVRMIDASELKNDGRRRNIMTDEHIAELVDLLHNGKQLPNVRSVDYRDIIVRGYMNPVKYLQLEIPMENAVQFHQVTSSIRRGAMLRAEELDNLICGERTEFQYLTLKDVADGRISRNLAYLKEINPRLSNACLKDCDLLISKLGNPFKIALAHIPAEQKILASGNFYIVTINRDIANPYYVKAFLESEKGTNALCRIASGNSVPGLAIGDLGIMMIPLPPLAEQNRIAAVYREKTDLIESLHEQLELAERSLKELLD